MPETGSTATLMEQYPTLFVGGAGIALVFLAAGSVHAAIQWRRRGGSAVVMPIVLVSHLLMSLLIFLLAAASLNVIATSIDAGGLVALAMYGAVATPAAWVMRRIDRSAYSSAMLRASIGTVIGSLGVLFLGAFFAGSDLPPAAPLVLLAVCVVVAVAFGGISLGNRVAKADDDHDMKASSQDHVD